MERIDVLRILALGGMALSMPGFSFNSSSRTTPNQRKTGFRHSVSRWTYGQYNLEELCDLVKEIGIESIELLDPDEYHTVIKKGLTCAVANGSSLGIEKGFNHPQYHGQLHKDYEKLIPMAADHGLENIICFSGNRGNIDNAAGLDFCARGLEPMVKLAEKYGIRLIMELLNSKVDHPDYQCDNTTWGVALSEKIGSDHFKLLYDIYHMQIMEGDIIATIKKHHQHFAHYHTAGVPGRNEIDQSQELNYPAIMKAIHDTGFTGFVGQEFIPKSDDLIKSLKNAIKICTV